MHKLTKMEYVPCIGTPKTDIEVSDYSYLGKKRVWVETYHDEEQDIDVLEHWEWQDVPEPEPQPEQMRS